MPTHTCSMCPRSWVVAMESVVSPGRFFSSLLLSTGISKVAGCWS